jgi:hypothetical protein
MKGWPSSGWIKSNSERFRDMFYAFFWVIPRRLNFIYRRFGTLCLFHLHRLVGVENFEIKFRDMYS